MIYFYEAKGSCIQGSTQNLLLSVTDEYFIQNEDMTEVFSELNNTTLVHWLSFCLACVHKESFGFIY